MDIDQLTTYAINVFHSLEPSAENEYAYIQYSQKQFMRQKLKTHIERIEKIVDKFPAGITVLDLGSGSGIFEWTVGMLEKDINVKSFTKVLDINNPSSRYNDAAVALGVELGYYDGDIFDTKIDLGIGEVDLVVFTHIPNPPNTLRDESKSLVLNTTLVNNITSSDFWGVNTKLLTDRAMDNVTLLKYGKHILT